MTKRKGNNSKKSKSSNSSSNNNSSSESIKEIKEETNNQDKTKITQSSRKSRQRQENSLGELTKNFIKLIKEQGENIVHINEVVKKLKVKKRRIYDITNVLEGMNLLKIYIILFLYILI